MNGYYDYTHKLYETFDDACDAIERNLGAYVENPRALFEKDTPNRNELEKQIHKSKTHKVLYYQLEYGQKFEILKMVIQKS